MYYRYGPYSQELSATVSELATFGLLAERSTSSGAFKYKITQDGKDFLDLLETNNLVEGYDIDEKNKELAKSFKDQDPSLLELESTILFLLDYGGLLRMPVLKPSNLSHILTTILVKLKKYSPK